MSVIGRAPPNAQRLTLSRQLKLTAVNETMRRGLTAVDEFIRQRLSVNAGDK